MHGLYSTKARSYSVNNLLTKRKAKVKAKAMGKVKGMSSATGKSTSIVGDSQAVTILR